MKDKRNEKRYHLSNNYFVSPLSLGKLSLIQLGRMHCAEGTIVEPHLHRNWFELTIVKDGTGKIQTGDVRVPVTKGDIYLSFPCELHAIETDRTAPLKFVFFAFYPEDAALREAMERIMTEHAAADRRIIADERIEHLVGGAIAELREPTPDEALLEPLLTLVVHYLIRDFEKKTQDRTTHTVGTREELCYRIMNYIDTHLYTIEGLSVLGEEFRFHYSYLSALFHEVTKEPLREYYTRRRLETARLLLLEGKLRVGQIAELLHYSSIYTFSRAFKSRYGSSPTVLRSQILSENAKKG